MPDFVRNEARRRWASASSRRSRRSLEWALFYCVDSRSATVAVEVLRQTAAADWSGHSPSRRASRTQVPPYGFRSSRRVVWVTSSAARRKGDRHRDRDDAGSARPRTSTPATSGCIPELPPPGARDKGDQDRRSHGEASSTVTGESRFDPSLRECVSLLLPDVRFGDSPTPPQTRSSLDESRLEARTALLGSLGYKLVNQIGNSARNALLDAEQQWQSYVDGDDAMPMINSLNASLQSVVRGLLAGAKNPRAR